MKSNNEVKTRRVCRKCLLKEMMENGDFYATLKANIDAVTGEDRADDVTYEGRLKVCKECDYLADGMCKACGCYVEYRAVKAKEKCPYKKW